MTEQVDLTKYDDIYKTATAESSDKEFTVIPDGIYDAEVQSMQLKEGKYGAYIQWDLYLNDRKDKKFSNLNRINYFKQELEILGFGFDPEAVFSEQLPELIKWINEPENKVLIRIQYRTTTSKDQNGESREKQYKNILGSI